MIDIITIFNKTWGQPHRAAKQEKIAYQKKNCLADFFVTSQPFI